jgi:hypothetical protein
VKPTRRQAQLLYALAQGPRTVRQLRRELNDSVPYSRMHQVRDRGWIYIAGHVVPGWTRRWGLTVAGRHALRELERSKQDA